MKGRNCQPPPLGIKKQDAIGDSTNYPDAKAGRPSRIFDQKQMEISQMEMLKKEPFARPLNWRTGTGC